MPRRISSRTSVEGLRREAKRWLKSLRAGDENARARLERALGSVPADPSLRDVQLALAREHELPGWTDLLREIERHTHYDLPADRDEAVQALLAAALDGNLRRANALLDAWPDIINERATLTGHDGRRTALHFANNAPHADMIDLLLERGADPNIRDDGDNAMPLHFAAERGRLDIVRSLIEHGADPIGTGDMHELDAIGWATCFEYAFHPDVAEYLLAHGARHNILSAVAMGDTDAIRTIVRHAPAELDRRMDRTNHRRRPLHLAIIKRQPRSLETLIELGADPDATDAAGLTPLDLAAMNGENAMAQRLIDAGARIDLPAAIALQRDDVVERLLRENPDALRPGDRWGRLIIRAAERGSGRIIDALVRAGASVHVRDDHDTAVDGTHGFTALHAAAFTGNADAVRALLRHGADPTVREDRYWGTPAGWADYAGHTDVRDIILDGPIDPFDAVAFDRLDRVDEILTRDPDALDRKVGVYLTGKDESKPWLDKAWTPLAWAVANGRTDAVRALLDRGANPNVRDSAGHTLAEVARARGHDDVVALLDSHDTPTTRTDPDFDRVVADFLIMACCDWRTAGSLRQLQAIDARRLLHRLPAIARANIHTAVVCGQLDLVRRMLDDVPARVSELGGPRGWPPILYLCSSRLPLDTATEASPATLRLLLERGADPNAFYLGGNADIHYTALTCVLGRGEEIAPMHPRARDLAAILLEGGADPHDNQVLYNVFADNTSRHLLEDDIVWLLDLMYEHSIRRGHAADWADLRWPMFDMRGAPSLGDEGRVHHGARFLLEAAVDRNLLGMAEWLLAHGAGPNLPRGELWRGSPRLTLYQEALARGHTEMAELLARYGAERTPLAREGIDAFIDACLAMDRDRVHELLDRHPEYLRDHRPMFAIIERDDADALAMLLDLGASPDTENPRSGRMRALHMAAANDATKCAMLLIERGAEIDPVETSFDSTPIGWASWYGNTRTIELLSHHTRNVWALVYRGFTTRLRELLRESPDLAKATNREGQTPLFWLPPDEATAFEAVELLIAHGADPARVDVHGHTAAGTARRRGFDDIAERLEAAENEI